MGERPISSWHVQLGLGSEGASGGAERPEFPDGPRGRRLALRFYLSPITERIERTSFAEATIWAKDRLTRFFQRDPTLIAHIPTLLVFTYYDNTPIAGGQLTDFTAEFEAEALAIGYRCAAEATYRL